MAETSKAFEVVKTDEEWRKILTPEQYQVLRRHGTERPGSCALLKEHRAGAFSCAGCGNPLFVADRKFESGTGWPSFFAPLEGAVGTTDDDSLFMRRTEVHCNRCGGHLGHVFEDGPPPTGLRYCINGVALNFVPAQQAVYVKGVGNQRNQVEERQARVRGVTVTRGRPGRDRRSRAAFALQRLQAELLLLSRSSSILRARARSSPPSWMKVTI